MFSQPTTIRRQQLPVEGVSSCSRRWQIRDSGPGHTLGHTGTAAQGSVVGVTACAQGTPALIPAGPSGALPGLLTSFTLFTLIHYIDRKQLSMASCCQKQSSGVTTCSRLQHISQSPEVLLSKKKNIYIFSASLSACHVLHSHLLGQKSHFWWLTRVQHWE